MLTAMDVARFFLSLDPDREFFNKKLISKNGRRFYEGNARLNKYLHLAQNVHIAKYGRPLFSDDLYAYDNGAVAIEVQEKYPAFVDRHVTAPELDDDICEFLIKIYEVFSEASLDELIELSHEDSEWDAKHRGYAKQDQKMDSMARVDEYREQYADIIEVLDGMVVA